MYEAICSPPPPPSKLVAVVLVMVVVVKAVEVMGDIVQLVAVSGEGGQMIMTDLLF